MKPEREKGVDPKPSPEQVAEPRADDSPASRSEALEIELATLEAMPPAKPPELGPPSPRTESDPQGS
jgi:hypothetical protein